MDLEVSIEHTYHVECWRDGALLWEDTFDNLVTTAGKNNYLDATLKTGVTSPTFFLGLVTGPGGSNTYAAADTMASHAGWAENTSYSQSTRPAWTPGSVAAGSVDNSASVAVFTINVTGPIVIGGAFLANNSTKGGTTGILMGVGSFTAGDRSVILDDVLNVTCTATIT
jgi:hypothetical protein